MTLHYTRLQQDAAVLTSASTAVKDYSSKGRLNGLYRKHGKRLLDICLIVVSAPLTIPLILIAAFLVSLDGSAPFYRQKRLGRNGIAFSMFKLRTMVPNADAALEGYLAENPKARAEWDANQKLRNDPRVTRIGRLLRKTSIDELPQLLNDLRGELSLIGPRPMMCNQRDMYPGTAYYRMLPGLSGLWQVTKRNDSDFRSRALFDRQYERSMSLSTDVKIIVKTFDVVARGTGC